MTNKIFIIFYQKRGDNIDTKKQNLELCKSGTMSALVAQRPYVLVFKTTNWCWNRCAHCCESSGPDAPRTFIPKSVIIDYTAQAAADPMFSKHVIFTGGEIMSAYKFAEERYVPDILNFALDKKLGVDIKTNAGWAGTPIGEQIFRDIENVIRRQRPKIVTSNNSNRQFPLHVSLSLDRFHNDSIKRNFKFIEHFANKKINGARLVARISSFTFDDEMFSELLQQLHNAGIRVDTATIINSETGQKKEGNLFSVNNNMVLEYGNSATLFDGGRAKNIAGAYHNPIPQFNFLTDDFQVLVAFDSFGNVTLGENSGKKISVPWRDANGNARPMTDIRKDLITATKAAEAEYIKQHSVLGFFGRFSR
ncbi:MAG: radical SAM protein [Alphaproteobacteria bacterium]|nr:radical SAM protein [Alphaproteobacteria bacterium]